MPHKVRKSRQCSRLVFWSGAHHLGFVWCTTWLVPGNPVAPLGLNLNFIAFDPTHTVHDKDHLGQYTVCTTGLQFLARTLSEESATPSIFLKLFIVELAFVHNRVVDSCWVYVAQYAVVCSLTL